MAAAEPGECAQPAQIFGVKPLTHLTRRLQKSLNAEPHAGSMRIRRVQIKLNIPEWLVHAIVIVALIGAVVAVFFLF